MVEHCPRNGHDSSNVALCDSIRVVCTHTGITTYLLELVEMFVEGFVLESSSIVT